MFTIHFLIEATYGSHFPFKVYTWVFIFSRRAAPAVIFRRINLVAAMKWNRIELIRYTSFTRTHMGPPVIKSQNHVRRH